MQFTRKAYERYINAIERGILSRNAEEPTEQEIIEIILDQEIVSYCRSQGCVSFDINDIEE